MTVAQTTHCAHAINFMLSPVCLSWSGRNAIYIVLIAFVIEGFGVVFFGWTLSTLPIRHITHPPVRLLLLAPRAAVAAVPSASATSTAAVLAILRPVLGLVAARVWVASTGSGTTAETLGSTSALGGLLGLGTLSGLRGRADAALRGGRLEAVVRGCGLLSRCRRGRLTQETVKARVRVCACRLSRGSLDVASAETSAATVVRGLVVIRGRRVRLAVSAIRRRVGRLGLRDRRRRGGRGRLAVQVAAGEGVILLEPGLGRLTIWI